jgi:glyceraldehyde-3-phosphate dehydrogenase (NADP+)
MIRVTSSFLIVAMIVTISSAQETTTSGVESVSSSSSSCATKLQELLTYTKTSKPYITPTMWLPSTIDFNAMEMIDVQSPMSINEKTSHCPTSGTSSSSNDNMEPIIEYESVVIGQMPQMNRNQSMEVLETAMSAWDNGKGIWTTQYTSVQRMEAINKVLEELKDTKRDEIIQALQWEIGKNYIDAASEFDRTLQFAKLVMHHMVTNPQYTGTGSTFQDYAAVATKTPGGIQDRVSSSSSSSSTISYSALTKRSAIGITLLLAPYNYPINECYATLIPALLLGNVCIVKIPSVGGLAHLLTIEAFAKFLPHGTINFISGPGAVVLPSIMETGNINALALIGSYKSADQLIRYHPQPHRLKLFLQLDAKNIGIVLPDLFHGVTERKDTALFRNAISESILGSLSYNGQRCTALKVFFVPKQQADIFVTKLTKAVEALTIGLPWQNHTTTTVTSKITYSQITPLPNMARIQFLQTRMEDAVLKGAKIMNQNGGTILGGPTSTVLVPAVMYPIRSDMNLYSEEQFGPIIPIVTYENIQEVLDYANESEFTQQVSIFGQDSTIITKIVDDLSAVATKINFNSQCARSPDILPFTARRSSGMGVMSVSDVLEEFSIPTVISYQNKELNEQIAKELFETSIFLGAAKGSVTK